MFDSYLKEIIDKLPMIENYNSIDFRSILSAAYLELIKYRTAYNDENSNIDDVILSLRKLGDTFEYLGLFNDNVNEDVKIASCFVAAESLGILTNILEHTITEHSAFSMDNYEITLFETGMLYHIAGYDANSVKVMRTLKDRINSRDLKSEIKWTLNQIIAICDGTNRSLEPAPLVSGDNLAEKNYSKLYIELGILANAYHTWLTGNKEIAPSVLIQRLDELINIFTNNYSSFYSTPIHIAKIFKEFIKSSYMRSIFHSVPRPNMDNHSIYESFLQKMALGTSSSPGQLFLWPSAMDFVNKCLPGPSTHSIICTPTGSGKSTIAKLAVSQSLNEGWVLYLAPTNALVHQIQRDLKKVKWPWDNVNIKSFIGVDEYTALSDDKLIDDEVGRHIYVMTPEKCALAMRLSPDVFKTCRLCIFDEFHEINSSSRGVTIDIIFGTLLSLSPLVRLQLISAMIENSEDLKEWLEKESEFGVNVISLKWRPTRTMRGVIGLEENAFIDAVNNASLKPKARTKMIATTPVFGLFGLQGAWQSNETSEYKFGNVGANYVFEFTKKPVTLNSWVNNTMGQLAFHFGSKNMKTIGFFPKNKHYPFTVARNMESIEIQTELWNEDIVRLLEIANAELGMPSKLEELLRKGISVHTSLMTQTEKNVAELSFKIGLAKVMLATSTLSQGLNLPAEVVLLGGTELGDEFNSLDFDSLITRKNSQFLNSIGRAGRAEFASQGLAIVVPSRPIMFKNERYNMMAAKRAAWFLEYQDASQKVESPLTSFLDRLIAGSIDTDFISEEELSLLPFFAENSPIPIDVLNKTFGAYKLHKKGYYAISTLAGPVINSIHDNFVKETNAPDWIFSSARKSGVTVFVVQDMLRTLNELNIPDDLEAKSWSMNSWSDLLIEILMLMNPDSLRSLLFSFFSFKDEKVPLYQENIEFTTWVSTDEWKKSWENIRRYLDFYYSSRNIKELGEKVLPHMKVSNERTQGAFLPTVLKLLEYKGPFENLSRYASVLISILEEIWKTKKPDEDIIVPFQLSMLPIAIKNGLKDINSVAWYKFGYRNRFAALTLGSIFEIDVSSNDNEKDISRLIHNKRKEILIMNPEEIQEKLTALNYTTNEIKAFFSIITEV
ncbi:TPA: DEAD/DEAH box helicase [Bacillus cereus]